MSGADVSEKSDDRQTQLRRSPLLIVCAAVFAAFWVEFAFVAIVDPYNIYPWGMMARLGQDDIDPEYAAYALDVVAKDPTVDALMIGGSTAVFYTRERLKWLPGVRNPVNLSYSGPRPRDIDIVEHIVLANSNAKRILVEFSWVYMANPQVMEPSFPEFLYDDNPLNDVRMVGIGALWQSVQLISRDGYVASAGLKSYEDNRRQSYNSFQMPAFQANLMHRVARRHNRIDARMDVGCDQWLFIKTSLLPFIKAEAAKGVSVDVVMPPYSLAAYYDVLDRSGETKVWQRFLPYVLASRRCLVTALDGVENVRVFAFDNEDWITGNLANYSDPTHVFNARVFDFMARSVAEGNHQLNRGNIDAYTRDLRLRVLSFGRSAVAQRKED